MAGATAGFQLVCCFDRYMLANMETDLSEIGSLNAISCKNFGAIVLKWLCLRWNFWNVSDSLLLNICTVFDCVDIDSRGIINWDDFTAYCVRVGRNQFKAMFHQSQLEFHQRIDDPMHIQSRKLFFIAATQTLYALDGDNPYVSIIG